MSSDSLTSSPLPQTGVRDDVFGIIPAQRPSAASESGDSEVYMPTMGAKEAGSRVKASELKVHVKKQVARRRNSYEAASRRIEDEVEEVIAQRDSHLARLELDFAEIYEVLLSRKQALAAQVRREADARERVLQGQREALRGKAEELAALEREGQQLESLSWSEEPDRLRSACDALRVKVDGVLERHRTQDATTSWEPAVTADVELDMGADVRTELASRGKVLAAPVPGEKKAPQAPASGRWLRKLSSSRSVVEEQP